MGFTHRLVPLEMFKDTTKKLEELIRLTKLLPFGATDCSKPTTWARKKEYDAIIIYTDAETNSHRITPYQSLQKYRTQMNLPNTKFVVVGMTSSQFSIANPEDINSMDVVGFDPETPEMIHVFLNGELDR